MRNAEGVEGESIERESVHDCQGLATALHCCPRDRSRSHRPCRTDPTTTPSDQTVAMARNLSIDISSHHRHSAFPYQTPPPERPCRDRCTRRLPSKPPRSRSCPAARIAQAAGCTSYFGCDRSGGRRELYVASSCDPLLSLASVRRLSEYLQELRERASKSKNICFRIIMTFFSKLEPRL